MTPDQLEHIEKISRPLKRHYPSLFSLDNPSGELLKPDLTPRTLLYGYDVDRNTFHVYAVPEADGLRYAIIVHVTDGREPVNITDVGFTDPQEIIPNKRLYPQYCDYGFCLYLKKLGAHLPFTTYEEPKRSGPYFAVVHDGAKRRSAVLSRETLPEDIDTGIPGLFVESIEEVQSAGESQFRIVFNYNPVPDTINPAWFYAADGRPLFGSASHQLPKLTVKVHA